MQTRPSAAWSSAIAASSSRARQPGNPGDRNEALRTALLTSDGGRVYFMLSRALGRG